MRPNPTPPLAFVPHSLRGQHHNLLVACLCLLDLASRALPEATLVETWERLKVRVNTPPQPPSH